MSKSLDPRSPFFDPQCIIGHRANDASEATVTLPPDPRLAAYEPQPDWLFPVMILASLALVYVGMVFAQAVTGRVEVVCRKCRENWTGEE